MHSALKINEQNLQNETLVSYKKHRHAKRARVIFINRSIRRTVHSNDLVKFFLGCDIQQEGNWKSIICKYNVTSVMVR